MQLRGGPSSGAPKHLFPAGIAADDTLHLVKSKSAQERQGTSGNVQEAAREAPQPGLIPSWMADSPFFRQMLDNPEVFRDMVMNNPAIQPILERNPELRAALNDTDRLRDLLRAQSNPALMREHMRNADRALKCVRPRCGPCAVAEVLPGNVTWVPLLAATSRASPAASKRSDAFTKTQRAP